MKTTEIRNKFLKFFEQKNHKIMKSDSLVPTGDPSLLFTGAGMNQFKEYFLGVRKDLKRATTSQKCLRTGDLDNVGKTPYHHSFFEMLGNFSFGDYFKEDAISWAWEFLIKEMGINPNRLRVSVHQNDEEAYKIWKDKIKIKSDWIYRMGDKSNFWPANAPKDGPNGPCGPCSEIYYDQNPEKGEKGDIEDESGRFAEIWNLVFTQYDRQSDGSLKPLAAKNIDTGMGLERLACVLQGKRTNFEIDLFAPMLTEMKKLFSGKISNEDLYTIVDHGRAVTFAILDGAYPSNEGRGYVIRKLIRRSVWRASTHDVNEPFLYKIVPTIVKAMGDAYPELKQSEKNVTDTIKQEEERFLLTLEKGSQILSKMIEKAHEPSSSGSISGKDVFLLYDTYGFPDELTRMIAARRGIQIDQKEFGKLMEEQRKRAKEGTKISANIFSVDEAKKEISHLPKTKFLGYQTLESEGKVLFVKTSEKMRVVILDQTPFYPEGGGQVGDQGEISGKNFEGMIRDTQKIDKVILHVVEIVKGDLKIGDTVKVSVDKEKRNATKRNHTATHLLQAALRSILGTHVRQVGSLVNPEKLRFDFTHTKALTSEEISRVEARVNSIILQNENVEESQENYTDATKKGVIAFFGDKYEDVVRVINVPNFSAELCGGTHCARTGDIGSFVIVSESAIASGTRRIEALTGENALSYTQKLRSEIKEAAMLLKTSPTELIIRITKLNQNLKESEKNEKKQGNQAIDPDMLIKKSTHEGSFQFITEIFKSHHRNNLRNICDILRKQKTQNTVIALFLIESENEVWLEIALSNDLKNSAKISASNLCNEASQIIGGAGGGHQEYAFGGGKNPSAIGAAQERLRTLLKGL